MNKTLFYTAFSLFLISTCYSAYAACKMSILPTRVIVENKQKKSRVLIKNNGDTACQFKADITDIVFDDDWKIVQDSQKEMFSAKDMIRIAPRSFTVNPRSTQIVWLKIRRLEDKLQGEYRSHFQIHETGNAAHADIAIKQINTQPLVSKTPTKTESTTMTSVPLSFKVTVPVLIRMGAIDHKVKIKNASISKDPDNKLKLDLVLHRSGNRTAYGSIKVLHKDKNDQEHLIADSGEIAIYRSNDIRNLSVSLKDLDKSKIPSKKIIIKYVTGKHDGDKVLDQQEINI